MSEALDRLKALAEKATPGPWRDDMHGYTWGPNDAMVADECHACEGVRIRGVGGRLPQKENAAYIAAAHPGTVLELIAENERLNERIDDLLNCSSFACPYEKRMQAAEREVGQLTRERDAEGRVGRNCTRLLGEAEAALTAEQEKAQRLREWIEQQKQYRSWSDTDNGRLLALRKLTEQLDTLGFAPTTPQEPK